MPYGKILGQILLRRMFMIILVYYEKVKKGSFRWFCFPFLLSFLLLLLFRGFSLVFIIIFPVVYVSFPPFQYLSIGILLFPSRLLTFVKVYAKGNFIITLSYLLLKSVVYLFSVILRGVRNELSFSGQSQYFSY